MKIVATLLVACLVHDACGQLTEVIVNSGAGKFVGFREVAELSGINVTIDKFLGIPYAEPPTGGLRFRKPVAKKPLTEPLKVQKFGSACLQNYFSMFPAFDTDSEDCLFLNIFRPKTDLDEKLPVMLWIHGGAFVLGSSNSYVGDALAANGPVIVVTINYRLSVWGFLTTEDENAPGNNGLWDQHLAIKWVHDNIESFGGDANRVTIFGESAGSASTTFQGIYPGNKGLFQRIIAQSGTFAASWAVRQNPKNDAEKLATQVGCETGEVKEMMECLRNVAAEKINNSINNIEDWGFSLPLSFVPSVDGEFVPVSPVKITDTDNDVGKDLKETFGSFDLLIGICSGEGGSAASDPMLGAVDVTAENFLPNKTFFDGHLVPLTVRGLFGDNTNQVMIDAVIAEYTDWDDPDNPESLRQSFCMMQGDSSMLGNLYRTTNMHASMKNRATYQYYFNLLPYMSIFPRPTWFKGSLHGDDLLYMFGNKVDLDVPGVSENRELQDWEVEAANDIMTLWTNFAKTGNPNKPRDLGLDWLPYTSTRHRTLEIVNKVTKSRLRERLRERKAKLWDEFLPSVMEATKCQKKEPSSGTCSRDGDCPP